jgi:catechol 2,3-dioxygenase-like lactoylglutathione lyase family enzyme
MAMEYDGLLAIAVNVSDLERAVEWYRAAFGFEVEARADDIGWVELATPYPGVTLGLSEVEGEPRVGGITPTFGVRDVDAARSHLEAQDVPFDGDTVEYEGMVRLATFYDPDGNAFMLAQNMAVPAGS